MARKRTGWSLIELEFNLKVTAWLINSHQGFIQGFFPSTTIELLGIISFVFQTKLI